MKQLNYYNTNNKIKKFDISIVCDTIRSPQNIGMCFRISESFGVKKIFLHENSPPIDNNKVKRTARNTINQINFDYYNNSYKLIKKLKEEGNKIIGVEITNESINIQDYDFSLEKNIVLYLGSERNGIKNINLLDSIISIPMYGRNSSMNVTHSLAISLYEITNQLNKI